MAEIGELCRQVLQSINDQMNDTLLPLEKSCDNECPGLAADAAKPRPHMRPDDQIRVPVSSSSVMNVMPLAVAGRCLSRTRPATR